MFPKFAVIVTATLAAFATAIPTSHGGSCNASNQYCCKSVTQSNAGNMPTLLARLGINVGAIPVGIGLNCVSATVIGGLTGSSWYALLACRIIKILIRPRQHTATHVLHRQHLRYELPILPTLPTSHAFPDYHFLESLITVACNPISV
jgi:hypothetical protein